MAESSGPQRPNPAKKEPSKESLGKLGRMGKGTMIGAGLGLGITVVGLPLVLGALGFTSAGIAAGSVAAKMMSASAIASGGGIAAGGPVAMLQSVGATGLALSTKLGVTAATSSAGAAIAAAKQPQKPGQ
ncbi:interferon alpha-inducible protein 27-like protein 2A [Sceloporus undulatus]|uniref:interferon alpha-inducible protein 27-like protein 2A n=1 Tax=Sceloporus undulatus TaxID=8520 RepID=UPI001C4D8265|nr:interferon alpha-inducible protein 27-like protein 2A [Sceloporus undulatus]